MINQTITTIEEDCSQMEVAFQHLQRILERQNIMTDRSHATSISIKEIKTKYLQLNFLLVVLLCHFMKYRLHD